MFLGEDLNLLFYLYSGYKNRKYFVFKYQCLKMFHIFSFVLMLKGIIVNILIGKYPIRSQ